MMLLRQLTFLCGALALSLLARTAHGQEPPASPTVESLLEQNRALEQRVQALEQAHLDSQVAAASEPETVAITNEEPFRIYGFADFGLNHVWVPRSSFLLGLLGTETTFVLGNLNMYFQFQPSVEWQVLAEIRFTSYPHGDEVALATPLGSEYLRTDTTVVDVASTATAFQFRWGGILIERAYAQYTYSEKLTVKVGQFLTPYGIWNVDHGTPTLIALMMPHFVSTQIFPARQLGIALHGAFLISGWELAYDVYLSNGRTATQLDFTSNKAFGARLKLARVAPIPLAFGMSFYHGQLDDLEKRLTSFQPFRVERVMTIDGTEVGAGLDASLDLGALRIRAEGIMTAVRFSEGKRPLITVAPPGSYLPDNNEYDAYLLTAYRLPFLGLEPFLFGEYVHSVSPFGDDQAVLAVGFNIYFTEHAQLKNELAHALFFDLDADGNFSDNNMTLLFSRLAVAF